ncbi:hypothetical protein GpartN1_g5463.t1 [Galdieria partita]|uniref:Serine/threonine-protein phosphatase 4 regulatory subunit 2 n=1 Tax=Galdieria partita TaxID=83374 RepID=A0A9C7USI2_9RHOD|nr:hypothetical protein GpartN1_g5463.t1 [Galdieria partita]
MSCDSWGTQETLLQQVATEGKLFVTWEELKICVVQVLERVCKNYLEKGTVEADSLECYAKLQSLVNTCHRAPFTIQRICELLLNPTYDRIEKFSQEFEKLFHVVSYVAEGEGLFTSNLLYLRHQMNPDWQLVDSESSSSSTETEMFSDAENSNTVISDVHQDSNMNGVEEDSTES